MLKGWPIALVGATVASAAVAFGFIQSPFATQAFALFIVFGAMLVVMVLVNKVFGGGGGHTHGGHGHGGGHGESEHAVVMSGRSVGTIGLVAAVLAVMYFWTDNELNGEKIGRFVDRGAASLGQQAQLTFTKLTNGESEESTANEQPPPQDS